MARVAFGVNCSPYLLQATIMYRLRESLVKGDISVYHYTALCESLYMDDLLSSFNSVDELNQFLEDSEFIFSKAGMNLHKWKSTVEYPEDTDRISTVLGVPWDRYEDNLVFNPPPVTGKVDSKRKFLALLASFFDPLGLCSPLVLYSKIILQRIWSDKSLDWDTPLTNQLQTQVDTWIDGLAQLPSVKFDRYVELDKPYDLHIFVDASERGIGAMAYAVTGSSSHLLCTKTRVVPLKPVTLARLELDAMVLGCKLKQFILENVAVQPTNIYLWSDSKNSIAWATSDNPRQWHTYVLNRAVFIQLAMNVKNIRFIPGCENPADIVSRGTCDPSVLNQPLYKHGPSWILDRNKFPTTSESFHTEEELRKSVVNTTVSQPNKPTELFTRVSDWNKLVRITSYIMRWRNYKRSQKPENDKLTHEELRTGELVLSRHIQILSFPDEREALLSGKPIPRTSPILRLDPELNSDDGLLRVNGRINHAGLPFHTKHPVILPYNNRLVESLVVKVHENLCHSGVDCMVTNIREKYWILKAPRLCRDIRTRCIICKRYDGPLPFVPKFAALPSDRVNLSRPFAAVGIDYAGPFKVRDRKTKDISKAYILLYVCPATRGVRLQVTDTMDTPEFILSYREFCARNCKPKLVRSDNAKKFIKASYMLNVDWRFNPPKAPWWGGFYERFVQLVKRPMRKVLGVALVTRKELSCIVAELETIVNQRPLTKPSVDKLDQEPITPAQLMGYSFTDEASAEFNANDATRRQRYLARLRQNLANRWKNEYLVTLQRVNKHGDAPELEIGQLVLVHNDKKPRSQWPLAEIIELCPGVDNILRVVKVRTATSEFYRPVQRVLPLEMNIRVQNPDELVDNISDEDLGDNVNANQNVDEQPENDEINPTDVPVQPARTTRSGRVVKKPVRMDI